MTFNESAEKAFWVYVRLGPGRSIEKAREAILSDRESYGFARVPSQRIFYGWSSRYHWEDRLRELMEEASEKTKEAMAEKEKERNVRHIKEAQALQTTGLKGLQSVDPCEMGADPSVRAIVEGVRMERLVAGDATRRTEVGPTGERPAFAPLSNEELEMLTWEASDRSRDAEEEDGNGQER